MSSCIKYPGFIGDLWNKIGTAIMGIFGAFRMISPDYEAATASGVPVANWIFKLSMNEYTFGVLHGV